MIKSYDGQTVRSAMIDAIVAQEMERRTDERVAELEAEVERLTTELELRKSREGRIYTRFIEAVNRDYPEPVRGTKLGNIGWALAGYAVLAFGALFDALGL